MDPAIDEHGKENTNLTTGKDDGKLAMASMLPKVSSEQRHQELNGAIPVGSSPLGFSKVSIATCLNHLFLLVDYEQAYLIYLHLNCVS